MQYIQEIHSHQNTWENNRLGEVPHWGFSRILISSQETYLDPSKGLCLSKVRTYSWRSPQWGVAKCNSVIVLYCYITNYFKLSDLKQHVFLISQFLWARSLVKIQWVLCLKLHKAAIKVSTELCSYLGRIHLDAHLSCWQNSFPSICVTEAGFAGLWRPPQVLEDIWSP